MTTKYAAPVSDPALVTKLFNTTQLSWMWLLVRVYLGYQWLEAGLHKIGDPGWVSTGNSLKGFWVKAAALPAAPAKPAITYDWYRGVIQFFIDTNSYTWFGKVIAYAEVAIGVALILGLLTGFAAFGGAMMNFSFMLAGSASTNPVLFLFAVLLLLAWKVAGYWGVDRWLLPRIGTPWRTNTSGMVPTRAIQ